jgi:pimeloyl-ACP methyl ester carboxylesterase
MSRVDVNGVGIEYQVTGQGRPVVLLHGFPDSGRLWRHQVTTLAGTGFGVIVPDLRGPETWVGPPVELPPVQAPTMGVWSTGDFALTEVQMTDSAKNVAGPWRYERLDGPGHWMQLEAPDQVNTLLLDFLPR